MPKFKDIIDVKNYWKARFDETSNNGQKNSHNFASGILRGIDLANEYSKQPSNKVVEDGQAKGWRCAKCGANNSRTQITCWWCFETPVT